MERDAIRRAEALDGYWDAVVRHDVESARSSDVGADITEILDGVQALGLSAPLFPDPKRGWRELLMRPELHGLRGEKPSRPMGTTRDREETPMIPSGVLSSVPPLIGVNGRVVLHPEPRVPFGNPSRRRQWMVIQFATAALLVLTLVGGLVAFRGSLRLIGPEQLMGSEQRSAIIPAVDSTPERVLSSDTIMDDIVLRARLETLGEMPSSRAKHQLALHRFQLAPGAEQPVGSQADTGVGINLFTVEAGQVTVEADAPVLVTRADANSASEPSPTSPGTAIVLEVGDQLNAPSGVSFLRRNDGSTPATVLDFSISSVGDIFRTAALPPGVTGGFNFPYRLLSTFPVVPAEATVHRLTLAPGAELALRDLPGLELVYVEAGALDLILDNGGALGTPERVRTISAGAGTETFGRTPERAVLANRSTEPVVLLTASVIPPSADVATP